MVWPHVTRIWNAEVFVEAVTRWRKFGMMPEMPFSRHASRVAFLLQHLR